MATVGIISNGLTTPTMQMIPNSVKPICNTSIMQAGSSSSICPMSFENRFRILPDELVLKNRIVALVMLSNMLLWRLRDARMHMEKNDRDRMKVITMVAMVMEE